METEMKKNIHFKICLIIIVLSLAQYVLSAPDSVKSATNNHLLSLGHEELFDSLSSCIVLNHIFLLDCECKDICRNLDYAFLDYLFRLVDNDSVENYEKANAVYILAMNGTTRSFNYLKMVINSDSGCIYYISITALRWFSEDLTIQFLKDLARRTTDPRAKKLIYGVIDSYSNIDNLFFFREELNNEDQLFYNIKWDCDFYFNSVTPHHPEISLKKSIWNCIEFLCNNNFNYNIDSLDNWIKKNKN
jgi:hypothetical protein